MVPSSLFRETVLGCFAEALHQRMSYYKFFGFVDLYDHTRNSRLIQCLKVIPDFH